MQIFLKKNKKNLKKQNMYPWYRESQIGVGQFCSPMSATIKTESGYNDCMLALDYAAQSKVNIVLWLDGVPSFLKKKKPIQKT